MQRSHAGLIGGLVCTFLLAAGLVVVGMLGGGSNRPPQAVAAVPAAAAPAAAGDCIPVAAHDGARAAGCVLASDQYATPPVYDRLVQKFGGVPVYADASAASRVGVFAGQLGFVPQALVGQIPALNACHGQLSQHLANPNAAITPSCTDLLTADGYPNGVLAGDAAPPADSTS
jgi:uncharacterized iron-regulated membrane protein